MVIIIFKNRKKAIISQEHADILSKKIQKEGVNQVFSLITNGKLILMVDASDITFMGSIDSIEKV